MEYPRVTSPKCPNHGVPLIKTNDKGVGICPISSARFAYDADEAEKNAKLKLAAGGKYILEADWKVTHIDGVDD